MSALPQKRTFVSASDTSAKCHKRTFIGALSTSAVQTRDSHRRIGVCPVGMDTFTHAQYGWRCGLPWRSHFRRVAKAGDEDVRSMTLHRAG